MLKRVTMCEIRFALIWVVIVLAMGIEKSQCSPVPFDPSQQESGASSVPAVSKSVTNHVIVEGSDHYNQLIQERRNISSVAGGGGSLVVPMLNSNVTGGVNGTFSQGCPPELCPHAHRDKQIRLANIKKYIEDALGIGRAPSANQGITRTPVTGDLSISMKSPRTPFSGQIQTFYASCSVPSNVDGDTWNAPGYFHLYFDFPQTEKENTTSEQSQNGSSINSVESKESASVEVPMASSPKGVTTVSAKLRLYKIGLGNQAESPKFETPIPSQPCNETEKDQDKVSLIPQMTPTKVALLGESMPVVEEKIRVSIYWYRAPVTKHHYKKKLLDTKMMSVKESKWVDFDIINAAIPWLDRDEKNYGIVVQVENEDNDLVDANKYFVNIPCSEDVSGGEGLRTPPMVEICTLNTPQASREVDAVDVPSFFPFPMGQSFSYLNRVAQAHANAGNTFSSNDWQSDGVTPSSATNPTTTLPHHKHRHGHGSSSQKAKRTPPTTSGNSSNSGFKLDEDHPLRHILATAVANGLNSRESRIRNTRQNLLRSQVIPQEPVASSSSSEREYSGERDIIIQKLYINSPNNRNNNDKKNTMNSEQGENTMSLDR